MPSKTARYLYWDSSVFVAYACKEAGRFEVIERLWAKIAEEPGSKIITASISIAEVAHIGQEKDRLRLDPDGESMLDAIWDDPSVLIVELPAHVMHLARTLMRDGTSRGWSLKPYDAVQMAAAMWVDRQVYKVDEINTYDGWDKYEPVIGIPIRQPTCDPEPEQLELFQERTEEY